MKKIISVLLSAVIVLTGITSFHVFAYDVNYETMTVDAVCNYPKDLASNNLVSGIDRTNTFKAHFIKAENEDNVYILLDDIKYITRSEIDEIPAGYRISQGDLVINLIKGGTDYYYCSYDKLSLPIRFVVYNNALYIEPEVILSLLSAQCSFTDTNNKRTLLVDLPQYTLFEALKGFDINKYYVGNLLTQGIKDNEHIVAGTLKFLGNFKRLYNQYALDSALNLKYELINPMGVDRQISSEMAEVYAQVLGYDIETDTNVAETESELYENIKNLLENFTDDDDSDNNIINFYIDSYAHTGARDEKSLELFNNTLKKLSNDEKVMSKLKEAGKTSMSILTNTIVEYMKRHSYDKKVLNNFKNTFSEEARNIVGLQLSDDNKDKIRYEAAMDYYETCFSDSALLKEIIDDELYSTIMEAIVMKPLDWSTGGAASEFIEVYEKIMTVAKLREMSSSFQPLTKIENASKYIFLTVMQRMIADIMSKAANKMKQSPNQSKEFFDVLMGSIDMFCRTSIVMMETLRDSCQQGALSDREKNILNNSDNYISELTVFDYKLRNSSVPDFSQNSIDTALKNKVFKNEFLGTITGRVMTQDEEPLKNAKISVFAVDNGVGIGFGEDVYYTDDDGKFSIPVSARNEYMLQVTCDGYQPTMIANINVQPGKTTKLNNIVLKIDSQITIPTDTLSYNGHSYYIYSGVANTWEEAKAYCESLGGYLAEINDEAENTALYNYMKSCGYQSAYFGYSDSETEGVWKWVNNDTSDYTNWAPGEPNQERTTEDYAMFYFKYTDGKWNDGDFNGRTVQDTSAFICEWDNAEKTDDNYKAQFIQALLDNESEWNKKYGDLNIVDVYFFDIDFDNRPEFLVKYGDNNKRIYKTKVYYFENGLKKYQSPINDGMSRFEVFLDTKSQKHILRGKNYSGTMMGAGGTHYFDIEIDRNSSKSTLYAYSSWSRNPSPPYDITFTYYKYDNVTYTTLEEAFNLAAEITEDEYKKIEIEKSENLVPVYVYSDEIEIQKYNKCSYAQKKDLLENACHSVEYQEHSDQIQYYNGKHYYTPSLTVLGGGSGSYDFSQVGADYAALLELNIMHDEYQRVKIDNFIIVNDVIYFTNKYMKNGPGTDTADLYKCDMNGGSVTKIAESVYDNFHYMNGNIYFKTNNNQFDGTEDKEQCYSISTGKITDADFSFASYNRQGRFSPFSLTDSSIEYYCGGMYYQMPNDDEEVIRTEKANMFIHRVDKNGKDVIVGKWMSQIR